MLARNMLRYICADLVKYLKKIILSREFFIQHRKSDKNFTRRRSLLFLMNLIKDSIQDELDDFFKAINGMDVAVRTVTKSAFCKARKRLKYQAFVELNSELVNFFYKKITYRRWNGFCYSLAMDQRLELQEQKRLPIISAHRILPKANPVLLPGYPISLMY